MYNKYLEKIASPGNMFSRFNPDAEKTILGNVKSMIGQALGPKNFKNGQRTNPIFQTKQNKHVLDALEKKKVAIGAELKHLYFPEEAMKPGETYQSAAHAMRRAKQADSLATTGARRALTGQVNMVRPKLKVPTIQEGQNGVLSQLRSV